MQLPTAPDADDYLLHRKMKRKWMINRKRRRKGMRKSRRMMVMRRNEGKQREKYDAIL